MAKKKANKQSAHTVADHLYGADLAHVHEGEADHDHDWFDENERLEDNPLWIQDHVTLHSVGIDIGSAGTQVVFSRINLRRMGEDLSSRYYVVSRETLFQSPVALTPYQNEERIDEAKLGAIIDDAYNTARIHPDDIDTGVVILTGEALRRENAEAIAGILAEQGGDFVTATAGHHMEAMLAAYGSGAARVSHDENKRILNIDIGGGTTKLGLVENGKVLVTAAIHIGGRLQVVDDNHRIVRLDPAGKYHAMQAGFSWSVGDTARAEDMDRVAEKMADTLVAALTVRPMPHHVEHLYLTDSIGELGRIDGIMFSGGVAEYVYERETRDFGDMGMRLGRALRRRVQSGALPWPLLPAGECIRATALGASEYSVQLSGNTSFISSPGQLLPRRNLQVLQPAFACEEKIDSQKLAQAIRGHFTAFDIPIDSDKDVALAFRWQGAPSYERIAAFAEGISEAMAPRLARRQPLYVMLDGDVAQTLGAILREEKQVQSEILAIDGVVLWDFDYIDLGRIRMPSNTVPVTIKSLVFSEDPRAPGPKQRLHHHEHGEHGHHHHPHEPGHGHTHDHSHSHDPAPAGKRRGGHG
ncbi:MAG TPA: ethanolamine ammonia-lyase reactivating factor EutA [Xanthobacteraceae bacterium]|nr:ethanolamine ammonia-lyase reactivating factor EutA [Xanthobacteraceae bacterium]